MESAMDGVGAGGWYRSEQPRDVADLATPEALLLLALRWWVRCYSRRESPLERLVAGMSRAGVRDAGFSVDGLMGVVARTGQRPVDIRCPRCPALSEDESVLLHAAWLAQEARSDLAERHLRTHLLTDAGAVFAIGPLEGLGSLFLGAGLVFGGRRRGDDQPDIASAWGMPEACSRTIH